MQAREFDAKLLTACVLAERGCRSIVGARHEIHNRIARLPARIYLAKDVAPPSRRILDVIAAMGLHIAFLDEEALIFPSEAGYLSRRVDPQSVAKIARIYSWGPRSTELMRLLPNAETRPLVETGNPRIDLLRPELRAFHQRDVDSIRAAHGPFFLFNSNFGSVNPASEAKSRRPEVVRSQHPDIGARLERRRQIYRAFLDLLPSVCRAFPHHKLIIRPHPAEAPTAWAQVADKHANCEVVTSGQSIPWSLAAIATLHSGCSTGFEAFVMGKVPISYRGVATAKDDGLSPDFFSEILDRVDAVIDALKARCTGDAPRPTAAQTEALARYVTALDGPLAAERLAAELLDFPPPARALALAPKLKAEMRALEKRIRGRNPQHKASRQANAHRYPGVSPEGIARKLADLRTALGRFDAVRATHLGGQVFRIHPA